MLPLGRVGQVSSPRKQIWELPGSIHRNASKHREIPTRLRAKQGAGMPLTKKGHRAKHSKPEGSPLRPAGVPELVSALILRCRGTKVELRLVPWAWSWRLRSSPQPLAFSPHPARQCLGYLEMQHCIRGFRCPFEYNMGKPVQSTRAVLLFLAVPKTRPSSRCWLSNWWRSSPDENTGQNMQNMEQESL